MSRPDLTPEQARSLADDLASRDKAELTLADGTVLRAEWVPDTNDRLSDDADLYAECAA